MNQGMLPYESLAIAKHAIYLCVSANRSILSYIFTNLVGGVKYVILSGLLFVDYKTPPSTNMV